MSGTSSTPSTTTSTFDFLVVANRLPVDVERRADGSVVLHPSPGGLVTALTPVLEQHQGCWLGWPGATDLELEPQVTAKGVTLHPLSLNSAEFEGFYEGFSNATLWPLYHDLIVAPVFDPAWWETYRQVNERFAAKAAELAAPGATVWVQDYQLQMVPGILRQLRPDVTIGFFLHIPFPSPDLFRQLPWREETLRGMLGADLVGFQLEANAENFLRLIPELTGAQSQVGLGDYVVAPAEELPQPNQHLRALITGPDGHTTGVGAFPISIATPSGRTAGGSGEEGGMEAALADAACLRRKLGDPELVFLGVDRLDYTKGILQRLCAFEELLDSGALDPRTSVLVQVATPSRERLEQYRATRREVEEAVGRINGRFGAIGRPVVHYRHASIPRDELEVLYRLADVMVVTPLKDGMNLVAKEYVSVHPDGSGALILSEFAGAAVELSHAHLLNPFDGESIKKAMLSAVSELRYQPKKAETRMRAMYEWVAQHDVHAWARNFLSCLPAQPSSR